MEKQIIFIKNLFSADTEKNVQLWTRNDSTEASETSVVVRCETGDFLAVVDINILIIKFDQHFSAWRQWVLKFHKDLFSGEYKNCWSNKDSFNFESFPKDISAIYYRTLQA